MRMTTPFLSPGFVHVLQEKVVGWAEFFLPKFRLCEIMLSGKYLPYVSKYK